MSTGNFPRDLVDFLWEYSLMTYNRDDIVALVNKELLTRKLTITALEKNSGLSKDTIRDFLRGKTHIPRADKMEKLMHYLRPQQKIQVIDYVSPTTEILPLHETLWVECPTGYDMDVVKAVLVKGDSLQPLFYDGWIIYYASNTLPTAMLPANGKLLQVPYNKANQENPFAEFIGKPCIVQLENGKLMLRTIRNSQQPSHYDLLSYNAPDITQVKITTAWKIVYIKT